MGWDPKIPTSKFVGMTPQLSCNNVMGAIRERCDGAKDAIPAALASDIIRKDRAPEGWASTFQTAITTLIPKFANHTLVDGSYSYDGLDSIPMWDEDGILELCNETTRIPAPDSLASADWFWQQYQILNLLRYWKKDFSDSDATDGYYRNVRHQATWADAKAAFDIAPPVSDPLLVKIPHFLSANEYLIGFTDIKIQYLTAPIPHLTDIYGWSSHGAAGYAWFPFGFYRHENAYNRVFCIAEQETDQTVETDYLFTPHLVDTPYPPDPTSDRYANYVANTFAPGYSTHLRALAIYRFTGPNGFQYRDFPAEYPPI